MQPKCVLLLLLSLACYGQVNSRAAFPALERPGSVSAPPAGEATISVTRLHHQPNRKAADLFLKAEKLSEKSAWEKAAAALEEGLRLDPDFSEGHSNLGVYYTSLGRVEDAATEFRRAIDLDATTSVYHSNLAFALLILKHHDDAEAEAREAVSLDGNNPTGHFVLGLELTRGSQTMNLAIQHLQYAASHELPDAHYALALVWMNRGDKRSADEELSAYARAVVRAGSRAPSR